MNRSTILRAAGLAIVIGSYAGCKLQPNAPPPKTQPLHLIPYDVGNRWITRTRSYDQKGTLRSETYDTNEISEAVTIAGETWYRFGPFHSDILVTNRIDGVWDRPHADSAAGLVYRYPARVGDTCATFRSSSPNGPATIINLIVTSVDSIVTVSAGEYRCIVYHQQERDTNGTAISAWDRGDSVEWDRYYCLAPGIGMIKWGVLAKRWKPGIAFSPYDAYDAYDAYEELKYYQLKQPG